MVDGHRKAERVADALFQRDRVRILGLRSPPPRAFCGLRSGTPSSCASASVWRTLRPSRDDALCRGQRIRHADQRAGVAGRQFAVGDEACTSAGSFVSRIMLATWLRLLPTIFAMSSWLCLNSSASA